MSARQRDNEFTSFGAEALPGGLREINAQRHGQPPGPERPAAGTPRTPLVGLLALARYWARRR